MERIDVKEEGGHGAAADGKVAVSQRKLEANRRNAQRSTGPRTSRGKNNSKYNAMKHGILAKGAVIRTGTGKEDEKEFNRLVRGVREAYKPEGDMQELLVEEIALCYQHKKRALRFEAGEIGDNCDRVLAEYEDRDEGDATVSAERRRFALWLQRAVRAVQRFGTVPESLMRKLSHFANILEFADFKAQLEGASNPFLEPAPDTPERRSCIKTLLLLHLNAHLGPLIEAIEQEDARVDRLLALSSFPTGPALDQILRYDGAIERRLQRAVAMLMLLKSKPCPQVGP